jgi:hypothetical protein
LEPLLGHSNGTNCGVPATVEIRSYCPSSGDFVSKEALSTDAKGNCLLGPVSIYPVPTVDNEDCDKNAPRLDVKIVPVSKEELHIFFSKDGGQTYYNPNLALLFGFLMLAMLMLMERIAVNPHPHPREGRRERMMIVANFFLRRL